MYIGQELSLDLGALMPVSMKILSIDDKKVVVEYLNSTPGRTEQFDIASFKSLCGEIDFNRKFFK